MSAETNNASARTAAGDKSRWPVVASPHVGYLSLAQAAQYLGSVSKDTIRRWIRDRSLPHYFIPCGQRGRLLFRKGELDRWARRFRNRFAKKDSAKALDATAIVGWTDLEHPGRTIQQ